MDAERQARERRQQLNALEQTLTRRDEKLTERLGAIEQRDKEFRAQEQALAGERQIRQRLGAKANGEYAQVAQVRAQLESAKWDLSQTTATAPAKSRGFSRRTMFNAAVGTAVAAEAPAEAAFAKDR